MVLPQGEEERERKTLLYSNFAILVMGAIQQLCFLPLRQTQGFVKALFTIANKVIPVPNYTTFCRRRRKVIIPKVNRRGSSVCLIVDSTGLKTVGAGEWRETWKGEEKLVEDTYSFNWSITKENVHDVRIFPRLLRGVEGKIEEIIGDSAYDSRKIYIMARDPQRSETIILRRFLRLGRKSGKIKMVIIGEMR